MVTRPRHLPAKTAGWLICRGNAPRGWPEPTPRPHRGGANRPELTRTLRLRQFASTLIRHRRSKGVIRNVASQRRGRGTRIPAQRRGGGAEDHAPPRRGGVIERLAVVARLRPGSGERARQIFAGGAPYGLD